MSTEPKKPPASEIKHATKVPSTYYNISSPENGFSVSLLLDPESNQSVLQFCTIQQKFGKNDQNFKDFLKSKLNISAHLQEEPIVEKVLTSYSGETPVTGTHTVGRNFIITNLASISEAISNLESTMSISGLTQTDIDKLRTTLTDITEAQATKNLMTKIPHKEEKSLGYGHFMPSPSAASQPQALTAQQTPTDPTTPLTSPKTPGRP